MTKNRQYGTLDSELCAAWLKQLQAEFEDICFQYRINLRLPIFELTESRTRLGAWHDHYRIISISSCLIRLHPWQTTLQVLKHEMAHQICTEQFLAADGGGHGPMFQQACDMVGLAGPFCRATADCAAGLASLDSSVCPNTEQGRRVLSKVEKLLALAGSDNEHEAALAMQRAGELLSRHNLDSGTEMDTVYRHLTLNTGRRRLPGYLRGVCSLLQEYFFVRVICASIYDPQLDVSLRTIELFGRPENVAIAEHCYHFLTTRLASLWQENRHRFKGSRQQVRNSYFHGVITGFHEKIAAGGQQCCRGSGGNKENIHALIVTEDVGLQEYVANSFPRLRRGVGRSRRIRLHADAYREAVATGKRLTLHRVVAKESVQGLRLLK